MRILFIAFDFGEFSIRLASALAEEVDELCLMLAEQQAAPHLQLLNSKVHFQPFYRPRLRRALQQLRLIAILIRSIRRFDPDVIHLQGWHLWFNLALPYLRRYPLVISIHDPKRHLGDKGAHNTPKTIIDFGYHRANRVIAHNPEMKQVIVKELGIAEDLIDIVPLVECGRPELAADGVKEEGNLVLYFGRIWKYKGVEYLIRAEPLVTEQIPDAQFVIAGQGDDFTPYRQMMVHPEKFIVYNDFVSYEKQADLFRQASIVALPYIEATQSGVIPVAYRFQKPVVATRVGGLPSQVDHQQTGLLIPPRDEKALARAIVYLLQNDELRWQWGENGRRKLEREWSAEVVARQTVRVYERVLQDRQMGRQASRQQEKNVLA